MTLGIYNEGCEERLFEILSEDCENHDVQLIAAQPFGMSPGTLVLARNYKGEYVTWLWNPVIGLHTGHYHDGTLDGFGAAIRDYRSRGQLW